MLLCGGLGAAGAAGRLTGEALLAALACLALVVVLLLVARGRALARKFEQHRQMFYGNRAVKLLIDAATGRVVDANPAACIFYGYSRSDLKQMEIGDISLMDTGRVLRALSPLEPEQDAPLIIPHRLASGEVRHVEVLSSPVEVEGQHLIYSIIRDVTERKQAEEALRESEARYRSLFENALEGIFRISAAGAFTEVNPALVQMLGYHSKEEVFALRIPEELFADPAEHARLYEEIEQSGTAEGIELHLKKASGSYVTVRSYARGLRDATGKLVGLEGMFVDVTEQKQFEQQLMESKDRAEEMARLKSSFLANMSHEIRTPLTGIIGVAAVLEEELGEEHRELVRLAKQSAQRLLETLSSVLDLARLEANAIEVNAQPLDVVAEVEASMQLFRGIAQQKNLALQLDMPPGEIHARLDRTFLHRILTNLISNAIKFTEHGSVTARVERIDGRVYIHVCDTGIGIGEAFRPNLFQEFKQESTGLSRTHQGSGLGLAITKRLVERMHGEIRVQSTKEAGSTFTLIFPCIAPEAVEQVDELPLSTSVSTSAL